MIMRYFSRRDWVYTAFAVVLILIQVYLDLRIPSHMSEITVALKHSDMATVNSEGTLMLICALFSAVSGIVNGVFASKVAANVSYTLRRLQFENVLRFSKKDVDDFSAASLITRSTNDVYQLQLFIARGLHIIVHAPAIAVLAIIVILGKDWHWTAATAVTMVFLVIVLAAVMSYSTKRFRKIQFLMDGVNSATRENLNGVRVIRAYNAEAYQKDKFDTANDAMLRNDLEVTRAMSVMFPLTSSLMNFLTMAIYWIGAGLIMNTPAYETQIVLFGDMVVFSSYAMQIFSGFMMFAQIFRMMPRATVSSKRITEVIERVPSVPDDGTEVPEDSTVVFDHVSFTYPGTDTKVLDDVSFTAKPGETVAIIGPTGSGKSTLMSILMRFYDPDEGSVSLGGRDIRLCSQEVVRRKLGYVPQQAIIFDGTVRDNVNYGDMAASNGNEQVLHALEVAQARGFVEKLPEGLDSEISQYGRNLSGGQKQRLCIARAVCRKPEVYVLDDCFSALDYITDLKVREALAAESSENIRIIVAQRLGTIMDADRILVMDGGRIVGNGTHEELLRTCPLYREIAESQISEVDA